MSSYFQTTILSPIQLEEYSHQAHVQEHRILCYFRAFPWITRTAEDLLYFMPTGTPITSVRRALTNLKKKNKIAKVGQVPGQYGRPISNYILAEVI